MRRKVRNGFDLIKTHFRQDLQNFVDIYFYFFPDERKKSQSASRNLYLIDAPFRSLPDIVENYSILTIEFEIA
ncbi:hypothetical protein D1BOALGB6SA_7184 [Olavius sp. associated proteobacterium Delta 1]|nr:hypothetical protein D1BOALGB6SA_7184 [Olavius sp. associated proteobacterium Delta 1]